MMAEEQKILPLIQRFCVFLLLFQISSWFTRYNSSFIAVILISLCFRSSPPQNWVYEVDFFYSCFSLKEFQGKTHNIPYSTTPALPEPHVLELGFAPLSELPESFGHYSLIKGINPQPKNPREQLGANKNRVSEEVAAAWPRKSNIP